MPDTFALDAAVKKAVESLKPGERGAVTFTATKEGGAVAVTWTPNTHVELGAYVDGAWGKNWGAGAKGKIAW